MVDNLVQETGKNIIQPNEMLYCAPAFDECLSKYLNLHCTIDFKQYYLVCRSYCNFKTEVPSPRNLQCVESPELGLDRYQLKVSMLVSQRKKWHCAICSIYTKYDVKQIPYLHFCLCPCVLTILKNSTNCATTCVLKPLWIVHSSSQSKEKTFPVRYTVCSYKGIIE